jgi:signal transduction histidine kinase
VAPDFEGADLGALVRDLSEDMLEMVGMDVNIHTDQLEDEFLNKELKLSAYRIAQEQFTNIVKYSQAKVVNILLSTSSDQFKMSIGDDGVGMWKGKSKSGIDGKYQEPGRRLKWRVHRYQFKRRGVHIRN